MGDTKCYRCGEPIYFDSKVKSKNGKYIPLDPKTKSPHNCIESSPPAKITSVSNPASKKNITYSVVAIAVISLVVIGIGISQANFGNFQNENVIEQSGSSEQKSQTTTNQAEPQATKLDSSKSFNNIPASQCSGNAKCFSGKVTGIVDGDTIKVDGQSIRFALASTPEINTEMGKAAKQYIQQICPMGSTVKVDEDDGQTQGSYGRIVGVIYCNGVNLNQAILEQGFGQIAYSRSFCDQSEFSDQSWSQCGGEKSTYSQPKYSSSYSTTSSGCDPSYSGVCIPIGSPDLDCADISGPVTVSGSDRHGLDRDGDGIGCE